MPSEIFKKRVELAKCILKNDDNAYDITWTSYYGKRKFDEFVCKIFSSTNENLNYFHSLCQFQGRDVLVPTASGDHAFNAVFLGAKSVQTFDINPLAQYIFDLKETAIKNLSYDEFISFFSTDIIDTPLNKDIYDSIRSELQEETRLFFDAMYEENFNEPLFGTPLVQNLYASSRDRRITQLNPYLKDSTNFYNLRENLLNLEQPITHTLCPAHQLPENFNPKDIIIFSNILSGYKLYDRKNFHEILNFVPAMLKNDGVASLYYDYNLYDCKSRVEEQNPEIFNHYKENTPNLKFLLDTIIIDSSFRFFDSTNSVCYFHKQSEQ